jgi:HEAT repeat protein
MLPLLLALAAACPAEDAEARAERFDGLIESLNASSSARMGVLETIYNELRGPDGREMREALRAALSRDNTLILQGVVEAMAMLGDPRDVANFEALLATSDKPEIKTAVIRLLPAFCLMSERARFNYINYAIGYERVARMDVLEPLRRPPLTRRGRLDQTLERLQDRVVRRLAAQFDPVNAALAYIDDPLYGQAARRTVAHFVGASLGNDPDRWAGIWAAQTGGMDMLAEDEVEEIRLAALLSLADMGAEGLPEVIDAFRLLFLTGGDVLMQAAFDAMAVMCRTMFDGYPTLSAMNWAAEDAVEAENWRLRRYASTANLAAYAAETAGITLRGDLDTAVFTSAVGCLGAALSYPAGYPDPEGVLAENRKLGLVRLERTMMMWDVSPEERNAAALALGEIGEERAVRALSSIIDSPYCSPEAGIDGTRMAESAIDSLRNIAVGGQNGRDAARAALLGLLADDRVFPPLRAGAPPVGLAHMALWKLQRLARSNDTALDAAAWKQRLGW